LSKKIGSQNKTTQYGGATAITLLTAAGFQAQRQSSLYVYKKKRLTSQNGSL